MSDEEPEENELSGIAGLLPALREYVQTQQTVQEPNVLYTGATLMCGSQFLHVKYNCAKSQLIVDDYGPVIIDDNGVCVPPYEWRRNLTAVCSELFFGSGLESILFSAYSEEIDWDLAAERRKVLGARPDDPPVLPCFERLDLTFGWTKLPYGEFELRPPPKIVVANRLAKLLAHISAPNVESVQQVKQHYLDELNRRYKEFCPNSSGTAERDLAVALGMDASEYDARRRPKSKIPLFQLLCEFVNGVDVDLKEEQE